MEPLVLCTGNPGKLAELRALLPEQVVVLSLKDVNIDLELPETGNTLEANALEKARFVHMRTGLPCLADDSGLEVDVLGGAPGVYSARYAGEQKDASANMAKVMTELNGVEDRSARFRTVLAWVFSGGERMFHGTCEGRIVEQSTGVGGFGYDPIFVPEGYDRTFAEMNMQEKNGISHRAKAIQQWIRSLEISGKLYPPADHASEDRA